ncbi:NAD(P)/FAD-dependent oxidoreductase [Desulforhopalus vacuolatus]|uniref:NAD(P)/FAD-dependent oxidoreductase n=1 Tax=Desulforhopalus vacuolatus TaxID=40414 RepID=UPI0019638C7F|nr:NAD(P)/FAD-dependent oxidoreductase [Desulforhopalus vacuolatus]MBM9518304.1 NAD(P)/FAD-dependent oxidoreductase [Desulforhopalus vacuolatus]
MKTKRIIVIGGGAAGLLAATSAARCGAETVLLEKMSRTGRKIGISGKGRCNITNSAGVEEFLSHFGRNGRFLRQCFQNFFSEDILKLLEEQGVSSVLERGGRWFPRSSRAMDVVRALSEMAKKSGVKVRHDTPAEEIVLRDGAVCGVRAGGKLIECSQVILATGGRSYPRTGSSGDGYPMVTRLGHTVSELYPALVPLVSSKKLTGLNGLSLRNISLRLFVNGKRKAQEFGEIAFQDGKIAGPLVLTLSEGIVRLLNKGKKIELAVDLKPALDEAKLDARLRRDLEKRREEKISSILRGLLPEELVELCLHECELDDSIDTTAFSAKQRVKLLHWLKDFRLPVVGYGGWAEAIVTSGGVSLKEIDPQTMQSRLVPGLYLVGELLDLAGDTGGFNLQLAFSTGWLAGESAAKAMASSTPHTP